MLRLIVTAATLLLLTPVAALAKTFPVPGDDPIATVTISDGWEPDAYDGGVEGTSPDKTVYVAAEVVAADEVAKATKEGMQFFEKQGVDIDGKTMKTKDMKINNLDAIDLTAEGKDKDGPTQVELTLVQTNAKDKFLMLYLWGSEKGQTDNLNDLKAILDSVQATK